MEFKVKRFVLMIVLMYCLLKFFSCNNLENKKGFFVWLLYILNLFCVFFLLLVYGIFLKYDKKF